MNDRPRIEKLRRDHHVDLFDCGQEALNRFLVRYAFQNQQAEASQTYVALVGDEIVGFYTLVVAQVEYDDAPQRLGKGLAKHPIPLMLLARLAVATSWQGKGLGSGLLKDAMLRTLQAADIAGIRAIAVHAKDDDARAFYERFGFVAAPTDPYHLFVLLKDVRAILKQRYHWANQTVEIPWTARSRVTSEPGSRRSTGDHLSRRGRRYTGRVRTAVAEDVPVSDRRPLEGVYHNSYRNLVFGLIHSPVNC
jgi:GNAT superfamily N-acetyltransferase